MAGLEDLYNQIPVADIASKLGADQGEVNQAIQTLVPTLLGSIQHNVVAEDIDSSKLESAIAAEGASGLIDGGVNVDDVDTGQGEQFVARIFGGNDTNQVASALAGTGAGGGDLIKRLLDTNVREGYRSRRPGWGPSEASPRYRRIPSSAGSTGRITRS